jgi:hypothetical protein
MLPSERNVQVRASANGKVFGMWCLSNSPSGVGVFVASDAGVQSYYGHWSAGYVVPSPDGKLLFTRFGKCVPQVSLMNMQELRGDPVLPACNGDCYLSLPPIARLGQGPAGSLPSKPGTPQPSQSSTGKAGALTVRALSNDKLIATLPDLDLQVPGEEGIKHDLPFDKRVHLIPEARLIITVPASNDRLVLYEFGG